MSTDTPPSTAVSTSTESSDGAEPAIETARRQLEHAAAHLDIDPNVVERLKHPAAVHEVTVPVERDDGTL